MSEGNGGWMEKDILCNVQVSAGIATMNEERVDRACPIHPWSTSSLDASKDLQLLRTFPANCVKKGNR
jgi:hypothetical protein